MARNPAKDQTGFFDNDDPEYPASDKDTEQFVQSGELWTIGRHKLLCGDTGNITNIKRLLDGKKAHLIHTDPPYNVAVDTVGRFHGSKKRGTVKTRMLKNDALSEANFIQRLYSWFGNMSMALQPGRSFYFWGGYSNCSVFPNVMKSTGLHFAQAIIWVKKKAVLSRRDFTAGHEWCFYGWKQQSGYPHYFNFIPGISDVWTFSTIPAKYTLHLTEKPVELPMCAIKSSSRTGEIILDPFAGSGSTLLAAEQLDRTCYLMEIDPWYCSVILDRCKRMGLDIARST